MAFVNLSLLLGTMLIGIPIALHLVMRQKPKQLVFPAIRFIKKRHESNRRTLRLRHWILLLLRCLVIALAALALARPSVSSNLFSNWIILIGLTLLVLLIGTLLLVGLFTRQGRLLLAGLAVVGAAALAALGTMLIGTLRQSDASLIGDRQAPVAVVMLVDSSPRMLYRRENLTRLEQAQEMADGVVRELPPDSQVAVLDSRAIAPVFSLDLSAARKAIDRVQITGAPRPFDQLLGKALQLLEQSSLKRKEIYVYTDLTAAAWELNDAARLLQQFEQAKDVGLYLIDVGVEEPQNVAVGTLELSAEMLPENSRLKISTTVSCTGPGGKQAVELLVEDLDPTLPMVQERELKLPTARVQSRHEVELADNGREPVEFTVSGLTSGTRHAVVRLVNQDVLPIDDQRFLTVVIRQPWLILVVAPGDVNTSGLVEVIAPHLYRVENRAAYECLVITPDEMPNHSLQDFAAVVLLDPTPLPASSWEKLGTYVRDGGQLAVFLGSEAGDGSAFHAPEALELLPGKLGHQYRAPGRDVYLAPHSYEHPILRNFRSIQTAVPWNEYPVFRHWSLQDLANDAEVILRFGDQQPALLERRVGRGTVLTMTTPITEIERPGKRQAWNELAASNDWPRAMLVNEMLRYLTQHDAGRFNFEAGQDVVLTNPADQDPARYLLFTPGGETQPVQARDDKVTIRTTETPGTYRLKGERDGPVLRGFSVNLPASASRLERTSPEQLDKLFGADRYQLARDQQQLVRVQGRQREGREFFPFLVTLVVAALILEQLLANRFYRDTNTGSA
ncbi:MAG: BatA domain-containing protein [Pirellulaceae bacterium]